LGRGKQQVQGYGQTCPLQAAQGKAPPAKVVDVEGMDAAAIRQAFSSENSANAAKSAGSVKQE
jgi:hypothetical protein